MLDIACKYEEKLQLLFANITFDEKYKFYDMGSYREKYKAIESTWAAHEFVSIDKDNNVLGYIKYGICRDSMDVHYLQIINFSDNKIIFGRDVFKCISEIFIKFNFRKIVFGVVVGNPIESTYDKLLKKYGGRIVGIFLKDCKLIDGKYYGSKKYEIFREDYLKHRNGDKI
ncbi:MAG TPA: hypothetical protein VIK86_04730 [Candidatus Paceibacterota bacterium]